MSLIKLSAMIIKDKYCWNNCFHGLIPNKETLLGINKKYNYVHYMQKDGNKLRHFTMAGPFGKINKNYKHGDNFYGAVHEFTNKDTKRKLNKFDEIYKFKNPESAKKFRKMLNEFD
jgi:hypothetical protein